MHKVIEFNEYKCPSYWAQQRKGHPIRERLLASAVLVLIIGGDILTSIIC